MEAEWRREHPDGEVLVFDTAPDAARLASELANPSLFAPARLLVVRNAVHVFEKKHEATAGELAEVVRRSAFAEVSLLLAAELGSPPKGPLVEAVQQRGEVRFLPLPEPPKPWEPLGLTPPQRAVLHDLLKRALPDLELSAEVRDALCEAYGFKPRELVQAASRLALTGELTPEAAHEQAGPGECWPREIEDLLIARDDRKLASLLARLSAGATLLDWRNNPVHPDEVAPFLARMLARLLRQALALHQLAQHAGVAAELDPRRCKARNWYQQTFKPSILPRLQREIEKDALSPLAATTPWQLHRLFRLAASYPAGSLLEALGRLVAANLERDRQQTWVMATLTSLLLTLTQPPTAQRAAAG